MLSKFRQRMESEKGFTLIELLVVILIIGILAAIALPAFLSQREKGQDAEAKSNARNMVTAIESCYASTQTYVGCQTSPDVTDSGITVGAGDGEVSLSGLGVDAYVITGQSKSGGDFIITKLAGNTPTRSCTGGTGGCNGATW